MSREATNLSIVPRKKVVRMLRFSLMMVITRVAAPLLLDSHDSLCARAVAVSLIRISSPFMCRKL